MASLESSIRWADGFLLLYSITQRPSFLEVPQLKRLIDQTKQSLGTELTLLGSFSNEIRKGSYAREPKSVMSDLPSRLGE